MCYFYYYFAESALIVALTIESTATDDAESFTNVESPSTTVVESLTCPSADLLEHELIENTVATTAIIVKLTFLITFIIFNFYYFVY